MTALFANEWMWLIFVIVGLVLVIAEVLGGVDTGFDLASIGVAFVVGGLIGTAFSTWPATVVAFSVVSIAYIAIGRRYIKNWAQTRETKTNVDTLMGRTGLVVKPIGKYERGRIKIDGMVWRASADEDIDEGTEVTITAVHGSTLIVGRQGGGQS